MDISEFSCQLDILRETEICTFCFRMKAGGNRKARVFLESQDDWDDRAPISQKYQSR